ncbi:TPA: hypothetical protein ACPY4J_004318 [Yersinia enterocolitica]
MNNIEELNIEYLKINARLVANGVAAISSKWAGETILALIAQLEAAQKERDEFRLAFQQNEQAKQELFAQKDLLITANLNISRRAEKAEAELSAANEKLSKPVVLPRMHVGFDGVSTNAGDSVRNKAISDCAESIRVAGFTVDEGQDLWLT